MKLDRAVLRGDPLDKQAGVAETFACTMSSLQEESRRGANARAGFFLEGQKKPSFFGL